ncbi:hypothetical protein HDU67_009895 [Dinochytrium kinnereticum]|nr:hypothetical protein HDU67_009895 [Dinochytrium kinnereticum]
MSLASLSAVLGELTIPTFDGYNERKFRVEVARMISRIKLSGTAPSDEALVEFVTENCFEGSDRVKALSSSRQLKAERVSSDTSMEEVLVESSFLDAAADTSSDMFDELLSMLLDQVDLDDLTGGRVKDSERKPKKEVDEEASDENPYEQKEARSKVVAASPTLLPVTVGFGPSAVTLHRVTLDPGSQVITVRHSVYNRIGTNAGIEEDAGITMRGAHSHIRKLLGLVPRLPISFHGLTYYVQAFIIVDRVDPKPPLGHPFLELARAETFCFEANRTGTFA